MDELWRLLRNPKLSTLGVLALLALGGLALLLLGYQGVAAATYPPAQTPFLISGSLFGIALLGSAMRLIVVHLDRVEAAREREQLVAIQRDALRLLSARSSDSR